MSRMRNLALAGAGSFALAGGVPAQAQEAQGEVAVAIVDVAVSKIDFDDPNVRVVQVNKDAQQKFARRDATVAKGISHGDVVASSFVREYRRLDPRQPIVIYAVNPMVERDGQMVVSTRAVAEAIPTLQAAGVRIAVTAIATDTPEGGDKFLKPFSNAGIALFAAAPNETSDRGIYPAASPNAISVGGTEVGYMRDSRASQWVDFQISGLHSLGRSGETKGGSSFAVAHAAAYGAYILNNNPDLPIASLKGEIRRFSRDGDRPVEDGKKRPILIGDLVMVQRITAPAAFAGRSDNRELPPLPASKGTMPSVQVSQAAIAQAASNAGLGR